MANDTLTNNYKVRLIAISSLLTSLNSSTAAQVIFEVTPTFSETGGVDYEPIQPVHMPGGMQVYKRTNSRVFTVGATFISRTSIEATQNLMNLQLLRGWRMPYFGSSSTIAAGSEQAKARKGNVQTNATANGAPLTPEQRALNAINRARKEGIELLGAPPDVLYLYAYSTSANDARKVNFGVNINRVPVVLTGLDITYPNDVDYLPTYVNGTNDAGSLYDATSEPFPMKMEINITLMETHSPREYEAFNLSMFKQGKLTGF